MNWQMLIILKKKKKRGGDLKPTKKLFFGGKLVQRTLWTKKNELLISNVWGLISTATHIDVIYAFTTHQQHTTRSSSASQLFCTPTKRLQRQSKVNSV